MRSSSAVSESGFTLIELMTVTCILVVLATLAIQCYSLYRRKAYDTHTEQMYVDIRRALENGRIDNPLSNPPQVYWVSVQTPGPVRQGNAGEFLPNLFNPPNIQMAAQRDDVCERGDSGDWCIAEWVWVWNCKGQKVKSWWRLHGGVESLSEWDMAGQC